MTVLVLGASSQVGVFLLPRLASAGVPVAAVSRSAPPLGTKQADLTWWIRDFAGLRSLPGPISSVVSCGPLSVLPAWLNQLPDLTRCVAFSSSSVHSKKTPEIIKLLEAESTVKEALARRKIALCLLRPTMIWGCGMDQNVSLLRTIGEKTGFIPVSAEGGGLRQPVHADDLAAAASHAVLAAHPVRHEGEIGGGSRLTYREVVEKTARSGRRRVRVVALPPWTFRFLVKLARMAPRFRGLDPGMVDRQSIDLVFDDRETRTVLNVSPRAFEPVTADFSLPSRVARFQLPPSSAADT